MTRRQGFTALELFVVIAVIGVLLALLAPAIGMAVESSRKTKCLSNLQHIGLATHQYEQVHRMFPGWQQDGVAYPIPPGQPAPVELRPNMASIQAQLLPYLEQTELFNELNLSACRIPSDEDDVAPEWNMLATAMRRRVAVFLCPSDGGRLQPGNNYRACLGSGPMYKFNGEFPDSGNGFFAQLYDQPGGQFPIRVSTIIDGLSKTAMFSERLLGSGDLEKFDPGRDSTILTTPPTTSGPTIVRCRALHDSALRGSGSWDPWMGRFWTSTGMRHTVYNHTMPPNSAIADCLAATWWGPTTARSAHPGGVNVLFGDGSSRFVMDQIDLSVWRAIATRNGAESMLNGSY